MRFTGSLRAFESEEPRRGGIHVIDLQNPAAIVVGESLFGNTYLAEISPDGRYAYVAGDIHQTFTSDIRFAVVDIQNPALPTLKTYRSAGLIDDFTMSSNGHYTFVTGSHGLGIFAIEDPSSPVKVGGGTYAATKLALTMNEQYAYTLGGMAANH